MKLNPFQFGTPVSGPYFYDRPGLTALIDNYVNNGIHVVMVGPRRFGKTSFLLKLLDAQEASGRRTLYVDLFSITSLRDFLIEFLRSLKRAQNIWERKASWVRSAVQNSNSKLSVSIPTGVPGNDLVLSAGSGAGGDAQDGNSKTEILKVLDEALALAPDVILAFDEFQKVALIDDGGWLEATLRSVMQAATRAGKGQAGASFVFTGSRRRLIHEMFNGPNRPFYRSCQMMDFPPPDGGFSEWICGRFADAEVMCDVATADHVRNLVMDTPNYVQMAGFHIVASGTNVVTRDSAYDIVMQMARQSSYAFETLLGSLSTVQQRVIRLAALEGRKVFSKELLERYEIKSAPHVTQALKALQTKQILDEDGTRDGMVVFDDPLFRLWLRGQFQHMLA